MKSQMIRKKFLDFFIKKGHKEEPSASLIPVNDPSLLFTNAGMVPFKDILTGRAKPSLGPRVVSYQKCIRAGGKHNDLENVGKTPRHHTFFEMLGNFSFGDYFKENAIVWAWEFLTDTLKLPKEKLFVTVHTSDKEAFKIWEGKTDLAKNHIFFRGDKSNFWSMGDIGPCGPCSEIFFDHGPKYSYESRNDCHEKPDLKECLLNDENRYVEIWNLVFMQYESYREKGGLKRETLEGKESRGKELKRRLLPKPSVDTGMGLERLAAILQGVYSNFDTDLFSPIIFEIEKLSQKQYKDSKFSESMRVVSDHVRSSVMMITDGVLPSNEGRGYVLRRIIRRAVRHLNKLDVKEPLLYKLVDSVFQSLGGAYPENEREHALAKKYLKLEETYFQKTLFSGMNLLEREIHLLKEKGKTSLKGEIAFKLYDTYGFPPDLVQVLLREEGLEFESRGFNKEMEKQKRRSQKASQFLDESEDKNKKYLKEFQEIREKYGETKFVGYEKTDVKGKLLKILKMNKVETVDQIDREGHIDHAASHVNHASKIQHKEDQTNQRGQERGNQERDVLGLIFDATSFYGESGGQAGDTGFIMKGQECIAKVIDTQKPLQDLHLHIVSFENDKNGEKGKSDHVNHAKDKKLKSKTFKFKEGESYTLLVDKKRRGLIARNHTATHLLHSALIKTLGNHVKQAGSFVGSSYLRFDFTHTEAMKRDEIRKVENIVNNEIRKSILVQPSIMTKKEAIDRGAFALFGEKYGDEVRVIDIKDFSIELCGGTHVSSTSEIGLFLIDRESSLASGVRRIEALTSEAAFCRVEKRMSLLKDLERKLHTQDSKLPFRIDQLIQDSKEKARKIKNLEGKLLSLKTENLFKDPEPLSHQLVFKSIVTEDKNEIRKIADLFMDKYSNGVVFIYSIDKSLNQSSHSSLLLRTFKGNQFIDCASLLKKVLSSSHGKGGGRADLAQGSVDSKKVKDVVLKIKEELSLKN